MNPPTTSESVEYQFWKVLVSFVGTAEGVVGELEAVVIGAERIAMVEGRVGNSGIGSMTSRTRTQAGTSPVRAAALLPQLPRFLFFL